jgi:hypothetical protein
MRLIFLFVCACYSLQLSAQSPIDTKKLKFKPMFNGKNFKGWYSYLPTKGKNADPDSVFTINNGLIHITGKEFGYLATEKAYSNFYMRLEFKWGTKKWPPRDADTTKRDNGVLFYVPLDAEDKVWQKSVECQIQEGDVGDFWMIDSATIVFDGVRTTPKDYQRAQKKKDGEKPTGEWNTVEIISDRGNITYIVNGITVNQGSAPSINNGRIVIQSEGAEIFYRNVEIALL